MIGGVIGNMHLGFSYIGFIFLLLLTVPNLIWTRYKPKDYEKYVLNEKRVFVCLERIGEVLVTGISLIFTDFNIQGLDIWLIWFGAAAVFMILYEIYWIRYFKSLHTMADFYSSFLGVPVAGATLPVIAFFLLGIYGKNIFLMAAVAILGIGHIGIHVMHRRELSHGE